MERLMKMKRMGYIALVSMISFLCGGAYADNCSQQCQEGDDICYQKCISYDSQQYEQRINNYENEDLDEGVEECDCFFGNSYSKGTYCYSVCELDQSLSEQMESCGEKYSRRYSTISNTIKETKISAMDGQTCQGFEECQEQVVHTILNLTGSDIIDKQYLNFRQYTSTIYSAYEKEYNTIGKKAKTNLNSCASYYNCQKKICLEDVKQEYKKGNEGYKNATGDVRKTKKVTYQNQQTECTNTYIKDVESNCTTGDNGYNANIRDFNDSLKEIRIQKNKAEQIVKTTATYRKDYLNFHCDDYKKGSTVYNEEDKQTTLYQQNKQKCDQLTADYEKMINKIKEGKEEVDIVQSQGVQFELTDSPREMLDIIVYKANNDMQIQETAMDGITSHGTAANCPAGAGRITRTLCWVKENIHPYIQWIVYAGLSLSIILLIWNGFLLVTNTVHGSAPDVKKRILYIGIGIVILTGFYYLIDLFMVIFAFIFD